MNSDDSWEPRMERARRLHRPSLEDWKRDGLKETFPAFVADLEQEGNYRSFYLDAETEKKNQHQQIPAVLDAAAVTREDFYRYEIEKIPSVLCNIPAGFDGGEWRGKWPAQENWQLERLVKDDTLMDRRFKCGEDDDERNIKIRLKHFLGYTEGNKDDSPLYIFDSAFDEDSKANRILRDYRVPSYFSDDLFGLVSESRRPPYRWFLVGPERSGTCVHIDPLATSAWNTLVVGKKRWVLFPPNVPKSVVKGRGLVREDEDDEAIHYFMYILPRIKRKAQSLRHAEQYEDFACYEFTQNAGETVFVPNGWWHAVLNLSDTVAVTQNFCSPRNFDDVWLKTRTGRKRMAWKWLCQLEIKYPELAARAKAANKRDNFAMKYDPVEIERREREERRRKAAKKLRKLRKKRRIFHRGWKRNPCVPKPRGTDCQSPDKESKRRRTDPRATVSP
mmetsp:Transcript_76047/g.114501  ORF Transcript_76047/g.114501 Transcript_76047/m.114501 type:complete len:447 (-) Transcript_76047:359-1699(-)|eukprot:CAMPEP_0117004120 /NCGR_PEP_ID=MMETSP0472-20121206/5211_1 /TAXON_ID=693140 ORGANISM="Tiarina fusus, Strain LIS" /NCGR_SAMPLE_ID=MMETSP0472 /ASSEMBLY_ACC=CAM_ASM_000603 /LENGTH=446 /DNA_ID=CAMNT_0004704993 /DNA_START=327 /DNA_END=1667 /DNA_ORIENTATION=+